MPLPLRSLVFPPTLAILAYVLHNNYFSTPSATTYCYPQIYTLGDNTTSSPASARCFTVQNGRIVSLTNDTVAGAETLSNLEPGTRHEDLVVLPGLWDGHGHTLALGEMLGSVKLYGASGVDDVINRIKHHKKSHPDAGTKDNWLRGIGWDQALLFPPETNSEPRMPTAFDLREFGNSTYIMLDRIDVHCVWVSQAVLDLLEKPLPKHVKGGTIPSEGTFCDNAVDLVKAVYPDREPSRDKIVEWTQKAHAALNAAGIVGVHDAGVQRGTLDAWRWMESMGLFSVRTDAMVECTARNTFCAGEGGEMHGQQSKGDMLNVQGVKIFADGALGSWGASMLEPYSDAPGSRGTLLTEAPELKDIIAQWFKAGWQVSVHAIGDRANMLAIDTYADLLSSVVAPPGGKKNDAHRLRLEHAQIVAPEDQTIMAELGIIPSIQPTHATSDFPYVLSRLGVDRLTKSAYRMGSLIKAGLRPVFGSDFPVESWDWRFGVYAATTRQNPYFFAPLTPEQSRQQLDEQLRDEFGWFAETVTLEQALKAFTRNVAASSGREHKFGSLEAGKAADWVVLGYNEQDLAHPVGSGVLEEGWGGDVRRLVVLETWVGGRRVFSRAKGLGREQESKEPETLKEKVLAVGERLMKQAEGWRGEGVMRWVQERFGGKVEEALKEENKA